MSENNLIIVSLVRLLEMRGSLKKSIESQRFVTSMQYTMYGLNFLFIRSYSFSDLNCVNLSEFENYRS